MNSPSAFQTQKIKPERTCQVSEELCELNAPPRCCGRLPHPLCLEAAPSQFHLVFPQSRGVGLTLSASRRAPGLRRQRDTLAHSTPHLARHRRGSGHRTHRLPHRTCPGGEAAVGDGTGDGKRSRFSMARQRPGANPVPGIPGNAPGSRCCPASRAEELFQVFQVPAGTAPRTTPGCPSPASAPNPPRWKRNAGGPGPRSRPGLWPRGSPSPPPCPSQPPTSCWPAGVSLAAPAMAPPTSHPERHLRRPGRGGGAAGQRAGSRPPSQHPARAPAPALPSGPGTGHPPETWDRAAPTPGPGQGIALRARDSSRPPQLHGLRGSRSGPGLFSSSPKTPPLPLEGMRGFPRCRGGEARCEWDTRAALEPGHGASRAAANSVWGGSRV